MDPTVEQLSDKDADKLFEESYNKALGAEVPATTPSKVEEPVVPVEEPEVPVEESTPVEEPAKPSPEDWLKEAPEELRTRYLKDMQDFRANASRNAALQRHLDEARRQLAEAKKPKEEPKHEQPKLDKWEALTKTDEELAVSVEQRIADAVARATLEFEKKLQERVVPLEAREQEAYVNRELYLLKQAVPNYEEVVRAPEFFNWLSNQSPMTRDKFENMSIS